MPSKSPAQHRLMEAAAHTPGGYDGVPQKVGKEFARADDAAGITKKPTPRAEHMAARKGNGQSYAKVGKEFGVSKSTAHRHASGLIRRGYTPMGKA